MRRTLITLCSLFLAVLTLTSCEDQLNIMFKDFYVCIKDSNNTDKSTVLSTSNEFWVSYLVYLISEKRDGDLTVEYEVIPGDGLKEGVDYKLTADRTVTFPKNVYKMPLRIQYLRHEVDPSKDNTTLRSSSAIPVRARSSASTWSRKSTTINQPLISVS